MAKGTTISIFEQHVEKGALALAAIFLIVAVFHWVIQSPRKVEVPAPRPNGQPGAKEALPPEQVDSKLHELAEGAKTFIDGQESTVPAPPDYVALMGRLQSSPFPQGLLADICLFQPPAPVEDIDIPVEAPVDMDALVANIPAPQSPPAVLIRRELSRRPVGNQGETPVTKIVSHVVMHYPLSAVEKAWSDELANARSTIGVIVADVEIESQFLKPDGSWESRETLLVSSGEEQPPVLPEFTGQNESEIAEVIGQMRANWADLISRPGYWPIYQTSSGQWGSWTEQWPESLAGIDEGDLLWRHDEDVMAERAYRYRYRIAFVNPIYGSLLDAGVDNPAAAAVKFLHSGWSPWSQPASVSASTTFFMRSAAPQGFVRVSVFTDAMGKTVSAGFRVDVGQRIGGVREVEIPNPIGGTAITTDVDFDTGAILVGLEDERPVFTGRLMRNSVEMIYLGSQGQLRSRVLLYDQQQLAIRQNQDR